jgi:hypothetical protein
MKNKILMVVIIIVGLFFLVVVKDFVFGPKPYVCKLLGGELTSYDEGLRSVPACGFKPAPDAGKICHSSDECYYDCTELGDVIGGVIGFCESHDYWRTHYYIKQDDEGWQIEYQRRGYTPEQLDQSYQDYLETKKDYEYQQGK